MKISSINKQSLAPTQFYFELIRDAEHIEQTFSVYPSKKNSLKISLPYRQVIKELYDAGCRLLQIDDCTWGVIVDDNFLNIISKESHLTPEELRREHKREFLELNNGILEDYQKI